MNSNCAICGIELDYGYTNPGCGLPMAFGKVDYASPVIFNVCKPCYDKHGIEQSVVPDRKDSPDEKLE